MSSKAGSWKMPEALSFTRISGIYLLIIFVIGFSLWLPELFPTSTTLRVIADSQAVIAIVSLGLVFPLAAGIFDVSIGWTLGAAGIVAASMVHGGDSVVLAIVVAILVALLIGLVNGLLVVTIGLESFIATLGISSVIQAVVFAVSNDQQILGLPKSFTDLGTADPLGIPISVIYLAVLAVVGWYVLEHTPYGRSLHVIGRGREAARLAGIPVRRYMYISLVIAAFAASLAGILVSARTNAGSPEIGVNYLLPVFAAVFLGATQFKRGRVNIFGALLATYLLGVGATGLQLAGAATWVTPLFNGVALIFALTLAELEGRFELRKTAKARAARRNLPRDDHGPDGSAGAAALGDNS